MEWVEKVPQWDGTDVDGGLLAVLILQYTIWNRVYHI